MVMSIFRKKRPNGTVSENWYYRFEINKVTYRGSTYLSDKSQAIAYEKSKKEMG